MNESRAEAGEILDAVVRTGIIYSIRNPIVALSDVAAGSQIDVFFRGADL